MTRRRRPIPARRTSPTGSTGGPGYELLGWRTWISRCGYEGPYSEHVRRSALTLKLLDYMPTGAMAAAPRSAHTPANA